MEERDRMLVRLWRERLLQQTGLCNADDRHQCFRENPAQIVRPFVCAPHFYGCLKCGQEHRCYADGRHCWPVVDPDNDTTVSCLFSGAVLNMVARTDYVGNHSAQLDAIDNQHHSLKQGTARGPRRYKQGRALLYTNIHVKMPPSKSAAPRQRRHREKAHPIELAPVEELSGSGSEEDAEEAEPTEEAVEVEHTEEAEVEEACDERSSRSDYRERYMDRQAQYTNREHWDSQFDYVTALVARFDDGTVTETVHYRSSGERPRPVFDASLLTPDLTHAVSLQVTRIVTDMVAVQWLAVGGDAAEDRIVARMSEFFTPRVCAVAVLLYNSPVMRRLCEVKARQTEKHKACVTVVSRSVRTEYVTGAEAHPSHDSVLSVTQICEALLFDLFAEDYCDEDQSESPVRIVVWRACPWLQSLAECGVTDVLYGEQSHFFVDVAQKRRRIEAPVKTKRANTLASGKHQAPLEFNYARKRVKNAVSIVRESLVHYKGNGAWLRHFIHDRGKT